MAQIVPAILEETKEGFLGKASRITKLPGVQRIQVDFCDRQFVPHQTLPVTEIDNLNPAFHWEADLMIKDPQDFLDYNISGFKTIILHFEAYHDKSDLKKALAAVQSLNLEPAIAINNDTEPQVLASFAETVKHFQIMGIVPGFQGTPFLPHTYEQVKTLRQLAPNAIIEVDGGIHFDNAKAVAEAGADLLIAGSALREAGSMQEALEKLQALVSAK